MGGLVLKHLERAYGVGRTKPPGGTGWWTWKAPPMRLHAVLVLARHGTGTRAGLYTQGAFALWHRGELVRVATASRGQANGDARRLDAWVRANTVRRAGPLREVKPELVFEVGFEGVRVSARHKSGLVVRRPRILRWREEKAAAEADDPAALRRLVME